MLETVAYKYALSCYNRTDGKQNHVPSKHKETLEHLPKKSYKFCCKYWANWTLSPTVSRHLSDASFKHIDGSVLDSYQSEKWSWLFMPVTVFNLTMVSAIWNFGTVKFPSLKHGDLGSWILNLKLTVVDEKAEWPKCLCTQNSTFHFIILGTQVHDVFFIFSRAVDFKIIC